MFMSCDRRRSAGGCTCRLQCLSAGPVLNFGRNLMSNQAQNSVSEPKKLTHRRRIVLWILGGTVLMLLAIIVSQQLWLWNVVRPGTASDTLVLYALSTLNFVAFVVFSFIFVRNLVKLRRERRERELGSKIKTRLLIYFITISFLPITAMAVFSYLFLNRSLEKWFSPIPDGLVQEAIEERRESLVRQNRNLRETASLLATILIQQSETERQETLDQMVAKAQLSALEIVNSDGSLAMRSRARLSTESGRRVGNAPRSGTRSQGVSSEKLLPMAKHST